ncbi:hypothetical protein K439DRAFT_1345405 [Ramaria rubella]|nr:hypothetical protein K439DRAFT_1345405 [Ramaria rubella]
MPSRWTVATGPILRARPVRIRLLRVTNLQDDVGLNSPPTSRRVSTDPQRPRTGPLPANDQYLSSFQLDSIRDRVKERITSLSSAATLSLAELGDRLNRVTGYEHIEQLKHKVVETEASIIAKRQAARDTKAAYEMAVTRRSNSQRDVNDLLQRKSSWTDSDVGRFTALVREDHLYEQEEVDAKAQVEVAEAKVESEFNELMRTILNRYHEEQIWSDKIRSASTYGSLLALGVNIGVFILAILVVEPWKRRRLAETFEKRIEQLSLENREMLGKGMHELAKHFEKQELVLAELSGASVQTIPVDREVSMLVSDDPKPSVEKTAKTARDRDLWVAGAVGALGGGILTILLSYLR